MQPSIIRNWDLAVLILLMTALLVPAAVAQVLPGDFVYLRDIDPSIIQDIRYAGVNNFMGRPIAGYGAAECVVKRAVGLALQKVQRDLAAQKLSLKMLDCYRPVRAVTGMVAWSQNGNETPAERRYNPAFRKQDLFRLGYIANHSQHSSAPRSILRWSISGPTIQRSLIPARPTPTAPRLLLPVHPREA